MDQDKKRELREIKRLIKRAGHKHVRQQVKRVIAEKPEEADRIEPGFGRYRSAELNGFDRDSTRRRDEEPPITPPET